MSELLDVICKQILRGYILNICEKAEPLGAGMEVIAAAMKKEGLIYDSEDIAVACQYLKSKGFVEIEEIKNDVLGISRSISKITAKGIDLLEGTITEPGITL